MKIIFQASHAKRHMAIHMERRPYACDICDRGFAYPSELKAHKEKHNKAKDSTCEVCGEGFESAKKLQQHEQVKFLFFLGVFFGISDSIMKLFLTHLFRNFI